MAFPDKKTIKKVLKILDKAEGSLGLPQNPTELDKFRYEICRQFVIYLRENNLRSKDLAKIVGVDEAIISKVVRYRNDRFSTDKLIHMLAKIYPKHHLILKVS